MLGFRFYLTLYAVTYLWTVDGFNINTGSVFRQFTGNDDSYFGYALAFMDNNWLFVGAPRDNDSSIQRVREPGSLWRCDIRNNACSPFSVDNKTGEDNVGNTYFKHGRETAWLGATIDVPLNDPNKGIVVCAPRWFNRKIAKNYFMNGLCYAIPVDMNTANIEKFPLLIRSANQNEKWQNRIFTYYGLASMGMSLHYTATNRELLMGAPGLLDWTGGFVRKSDSVVVMKSAIDKVLETAHQYIGYSVTSGKYFSDKMEYYALGAPRSELVGKVYFFQGGLDEYILGNASLELKGLGSDNKELPVNSYFGSVLCTVDVNNDGYDDLLVAAPLFGNTSAADEKNMGDMVDVGRVFLYLGNTMRVDFSKKVFTFYGDSMPHARFGSAISSMGDINKDDYKDVAIGAPYEDDMRGAVYIYNGYKDGLWAMYSQKIVARHLNEELRAFGYTISNPMDLNSDDILDIAIGSYMSSHVTVLLGQPVINMDARMMVTEDSINDLKVIDKNSNTTYVKVCFRYFHNRCGRVKLNVTLTLDTEKGDLTRVYFKENQMATLSFELTGFSNDKSCSNSDTAKIFVRPTFDLLSPIVIMMQYEMISNNCPLNSNATISKFNGNSPGDPVLMLRKQLQLKNECPNNNCSTDLHLEAKAIYKNIDGFFVVGTPSLTLNINITKTGDPSYGSLFRTTIPNTLRYRKQEQTSGASVVTCSLEKSSDELTTSLEKFKNESVLECSFGNPMFEDDGVEFNLFFHVPDSISGNSIAFRMESSSLSNEESNEDNNKRLEIKMKNHVMATLSGVSNPETLFIQEQTPSYEIKHVYELENRGPSLLPSAEIKIAFPQIQSPGTASLFLNKTQIRCPRPCEIDCAIDGEDQFPLVWTDINGRNKHVNSRIEERQLTPLRHLNCDVGPCLIYSCNLINLSPLKSVSFELNFVVLKHVEGILKSQKTLEIVTTAKAHLNAMDLISDTTRLQHKLQTVLLPRMPRKTGVDWWIIIISILCGLILIALIIFILYKVGFFKRKRVPQARPRKVSEKGEVIDEKESVSLTDSEHDIIDKNGK